MQSRKNIKIASLFLLFCSTYNFGAEQPKPKECAFVKESAKINRQLSLRLSNSLKTHKCSINAQNEDGDTALILACAQGSMSKAKALLDLKANPNVINKSGKSALYHVLSCHEINDDATLPFVQLLVAHNAQVDTCQSIICPLMFCMAPNCSKMLEFLLTHGGGFRSISKNVRVQCLENGTWRTVAQLENVTPCQTLERYPAQDRILYHNIMAQVAKNYRIQIRQGLPTTFNFSLVKIISEFHGCLADRAIQNPEGLNLERLKADYKDHFKGPDRRRKREIMEAFLGVRFKEKKNPAFACNE